MPIRILSLLLAATMIFAQDKPPEKPSDASPAQPSESEVVQVKTLTGDAFDRLLNLLSVFKIGIKGDRDLRIVVLYGPKDTVAQARHVIDQLDKPGSEAAMGKDIEATFTFLRCSTSPPDSPVNLPAGMDSVARELRAITPFKTITISDVIPLRLQEGKDGSTDLKLPGGPKGAIVSIAAHPEAIYRRDQKQYVRFNRMTIVTSNAGPVLFQIRTSGEFGVGQKTVLGKLSDSASEDAIFVVIELKVLD